MRLLEHDAPAATRRPEVRAVDPWQGAEGARLLCARCGHPITASGWARDVDGHHEHSFFNPHGYLFRIGCFRQAPGCVPRGEEHAAYSWFDGFTWQIAHCLGCDTHLGWGFRGAEDRFHGLVLDRLVQQVDGGAIPRA
jgi:hypothetical protein